MLFENQTKSAQEQTVLKEALSRQHYEAMADMLKKHKDMHPEMHKSLAHHMATHFAQDNPRFDRGRFLKAAGAE